MDGFATAALAMAVILSAIVRLIRTDAAWKAVDEGYAGVDHVRDLTGVFDPRALQDIFGPPTMEGIYRVSRAEILGARRITGWMMGDFRLDLACMLIALIMLIWTPYSGLRVVLQTVFLGAVIYQVGGWLAATGFLGRKV